KVVAARHQAGIFLAVFAGSSITDAPAPELFVPVVLRHYQFVAGSQEKRAKMRGAGEFVESVLPHQFQRQPWCPIAALLESLGQFASPPNRKGCISKHGPEVGSIVLRSQECRLCRVVDDAVVSRQTVVRGIEEVVLPFEFGNHERLLDVARWRTATSWAAANVRGLGFARLER